MRKVHRAHDCCDERRAWRNRKFDHDDIRAAIGEREQSRKVRVRPQTNRVCNRELGNWMDVAGGTVRYSMRALMMSIFS